MAPLLRHKYRIAGGIAVAAAAGMAWAQQSDVPGTEAFIDFTTGFEASDNPEGLDDPSEDLAVLSVTDFVLGVDSRTRSEEFSARVGFSLEFGDQPDDPSFEDGVADPFFSIEYLRQNRSSMIGLGVQVRDSDIDFNITDDFLDNDFDSDDLIVDEGTRRDRRLDFELELGRDGPVGLAVDAFYAERGYIDTTNPDLNDSTQFRIDVDGRVALSRTVDLTASVLLRGRDEEDDEELQDRDLNSQIGLSVRVDPALRFNVGVGFGRSETERTNVNTGVRTTDEVEGTTYSFGIVRDVDNGSVSFNASSSVVPTGVQSDLRFGRSMVLRTGRLDVTAGIGVTDDGDVQPLGSLDWVRELRDGRISARFRQQLSTDTEAGEEFDTLNSTFRVVYDRDLTAASTLSLDMSFAAVNSIDDDLGTDRRRSSVGIAYRRQLTSDWDLNTGYRYNLLDEADEADVHENEVFATIGRRFSLRP